MTNFSKKTWLWITYVLATLALAVYLGIQLVAEPLKQDFLIGETSHGHYQIELSCNACHTEAFGGTEMIQNTCVDCHEDELKAAMDSHPKSKFTDPRNADLVDILDARYCVSCHVEHNPDVLHPMGVSLQTDYCVQCHLDIGDDRPSHENMEFDSCASAGCHNYHDNTALYENFLLKHQDITNPVIRQQPEKALSRYFEQKQISWQKVSMEAASAEPLAKQHHDAQIHADWETSAHAENGVACTSCHVDAETADAQWIEQPSHEVCASCHEAETEGFLSGKHGMRLAQNLPPMTPAQARLPMHEQSQHLQLECSSCHNAHSTNIVQASVESCLGCHADEHSRNFKQSPHGELWEQAGRGEIPMEAAVSCATCHLPRVEQDILGEKLIKVEHNQNATLRPNEKMIRSSCMNCHSLAFSIDALADPNLIENNFQHAPTVHIKSIDMAVARDNEAQAKKGDANN